MSISYFKSKVKRKNIFSRFFVNQPDKSCSRLSEKVSKGRLFRPDKLKIAVTKDKDSRKKEREGSKEEK